MGTPDTSTYLNISKGYDQSDERVADLFNSVMNSRADEEVFVHNILALCSYAFHYGDTAIKLGERLEQQKKQFDSILANLENRVVETLTKRKEELQREAFGKVAEKMGIAAEPQAPYGE